jgi:hypothetical protein
MPLHLTTSLPCAPEEAWREMHKPALFAYVTAPLVRFTPVQPPSLPEAWRDGSTTIRMALFGVLPLGKQTIVITPPIVSGTDERPHYQMFDRGHGQLARKWHHTITIATNDDGTTRYSDTVDVDAGLLTPFVVLFASVLFRWRQRRWRRLARNNFDYTR